MAALTLAERLEQRARLPHFLAYRIKPLAALGTVAAAAMKVPVATSLFEAIESAFAWIGTHPLPLDLLTRLLPAGPAFPAIPDLLKWLLPWDSVTSLQVLVAAAIGVWALTPSDPEQDAPLTKINEWFARTVARDQAPERKEQHYRFEFDLLDQKAASERESVWRAVRSLCGVLGRLLVKVGEGLAVLLVLSAVGPLLGAVIGGVCLLLAWTPGLKRIAGLMRRLFVDWPQYLGAFMVLHLEAWITEMDVQLLDLELVRAQADERLTWSSTEEQQQQREQEATRKMLAPFLEPLVFAPKQYIGVNVRAVRLSSDPRFPADEAGVASIYVRQRRFLEGDTYLDEDTHYFMPARDARPLVPQLFYQLEYHICQRHNGPQHIVLPQGDYTLRKEDALTGLVDSSQKKDMAMTRANYVNVQRTFPDRSQDKMFVWSSPLAWFHALLHDPERGRPDVSDDQELDLLDELRDLAEALVPIDAEAGRVPRLLFERDGPISLWLDLRFDEKRRRWRPGQTNPYQPGLLLDKNYVEVRELIQRFGKRRDAPSWEPICLYVLRCRTAAQSVRLQALALGYLERLADVCGWLMVVPLSPDNPFFVREKHRTEIPGTSGVGRYVRKVLLNRDVAYMREPAAFGTRD